jgi:transcriptional regulator with XRE-family HTH domain
MPHDEQESSREAWVEFAQRLKKFRVEHGLSQERLADRVPYSESAVGHVERLMRKPSEDLTRELEKALGLDGQLMELLPQIHGVLGSRWFREWPKVEATAHAIRTWEPMLIPGLLQTESYARKVFLGEPGRRNMRARRRCSSGFTGKPFSVVQGRPCTRL